MIVNWEVTKHIMDMVSSLDVAILMAGGTPPSTERLLNMSVKELLEQYACNDIRFVYQPPTPPATSLDEAECCHLTLTLPRGPSADDIPF